MRSMISTLAATLSLAALFCSQVTFAQVTASPSVINFQGRLATPSGNPVPDGTYSIRFSLHDALSAGTERWNQTLQSVTVKNGTFAVPLSGFSSTLFDGNLWLEIKIGTDAPLAPRTPLLSVPYALKSNIALTVPDASITNDKLAGDITADKLAVNTLNGTAWLINGNSGVSSGFLGTTDNQSLAFRTNNTERMRLLSNGNVGIGTNNPSAMFQVGSGLDFSNLTTLGVVQRSTDTVALSLRQFSGSSRNTVMQFITGNLGNYIEHQRTSGNLLIGTNGSGGSPTLTVASGRVGIGVLNPTDILTVGGAGSAISVLDSAVRTRLFSANATGSGYIGTASAHDFILRTGDVDRITINNTGYVGVGNAGFNNARLTAAANGLSYAIATLDNVVAANYLTVSDSRLKQTIETVPDALTTLLNLRGVSYDWNANVPNGIKGQKERQYGFLAQEVEQTLPALVHPGLNGYKAVNYIGIIPVTVEAIKAQQSQISALRRENENIRKDNEAKQNQIDALRTSLETLVKRLDAMERQR